MGMSMLILIHYRVELYKMTGEAVMQTILARHRVKRRTFLCLEEEGVQLG